SAALGSEPAADPGTVPERWLAVAAEIERRQRELRPFLQDARAVGGGHEATADEVDRLLREVGDRARAAAGPDGPARDRHTPGGGPGGTAQRRPVPAPARQRGVAAAALAAPHGVRRRRPRVPGVGGRCRTRAGRYPDRRLVQTAVRRPRPADRTARPGRLPRR